MPLVRSTEPSSRATIIKSVKLCWRIESSCSLRNVSPLNVDSKIASRLCSTIGSVQRLRVADAGTNALPVKSAILRAHDKPARFDKKSDSITQLPSQGRIASSIQMRPITAGIIGARGIVLRHQTSTHQRIFTSFSDRMVEYLSLIHI